MNRRAKRPPADQKRTFDLMFRFYGPKELFEKTWVLPDVGKAM